MLHLFCRSLSANTSAAVESLKADMQDVQALPDVILSRIEDRFEAMEITVVNALERPRHVRPPQPPAYEPPWMSAIRRTASVGRRVRLCTPGCTCQCHLLSSYSLRFTYLRSLFGSMAVGYKGYSASSGTCPRCGTRQSQSLGLIYHFPAWLVRSSLIIACSTNLSGGPQINLRVVQRVGSMRSAEYTHGIFGCIHHGDIEGLKNVLARGLGSVHDLLEPRGRTPLEYAIVKFSTTKTLRLDIARLLVDEGSDPYHGLFDKGLGLRSTAPGLAIQHSAGRIKGWSLDRFSELFSLADYIEHAKYTSLHLAALGILHFDLDEALQKPELRACINQRSADAMTALDAAALTGNLGAVRSLLRAGADVHAMDWQSGTSPLKMACSYNHTSVVELLLQAGAPVTNNNQVGRSPLHYVCENVEGDTAILRLLIQHGADVNCETTNGKYQALDYAAGNGNFEAVRFLLENGADVSHRDSEGDMVLSTAIHNRSGRIAKLLLQYGYDLLSVNKFGDSLLHDLAYSGDAEMMDIFAIHASSRMRGLSVSSTNLAGRTPMHILADRNPDGELRKAFDRLLDSIDKEPENSIDEQDEVFVDAVAVLEENGMHEVMTQTGTENKDHSFAVAA